MNKHDLNALILLIINNSIKKKSKIVNPCSVFDIQKKKMKISARKGFAIPSEQCIPWLIFAAYDLSKPVSAQNK